jgi:hypothetical protein
MSMSGHLTQLVVICSLAFACSGKKTSTSGDSQKASTSDSTDQAYVDGRVEEKDSDKFVSEIDVTDFSTVESQETTGVNLVTQSPSVEIYKMIRSAGGSYSFQIDQ